MLVVPTLHALFIWFRSPAFTNTSVGFFKALLSFHHTISHFTSVIISVVIIAESFTLAVKVFAWYLHFHEMFLHSLGVVVFTPSSLHVTLSWVVKVSASLFAVSTFEVATHVTGMFVAHASFVTFVVGVFPAIVTVVIGLLVVEPLRVHVEVFAVSSAWV